MNSEELKNYLDDLQKNTSGMESFQIIFGMLNQNPTIEARELLEIYLMGFAFHPDCTNEQIDQVVIYWEPFLHGQDFLARPRAMNRLFLLCKHSILAKSILQKFLGEEPSEESIKKKHRSFFDDAMNGKS